MRSAPTRYVRAPPLQAKCEEVGQVGSAEVRKCGSAEVRECVSAEVLSAKC
jgi:hypothetical protein